MDSILLLGVPLSRYTIHCNLSHAAANAAARRLREWLYTHCNADLVLSDSTPAPDDACILIDPDPHAAYGEGALCANGGQVCIRGNDIVGLTEAAAYLTHCLVHGKATKTALCYRTKLPERAGYVANAAAFAPCYRHAHPAPHHPLTLAEKRQALRDPAGRLFVIAHRGEHVFYPENSLESALSAWLCGADAVEVDIQKSADGVWMCMHDTDVTRTTNAAALLGKDGYPHSPLLCDWTYAQLRTLRLKDACGTLTPFPIPTLEEIMRACDGRIFMHLDKPFTVAEDVFPYMEALGIYDCVYLVNHVGVNEILRLKDHFADRGIRLESICRPRREMTLAKTLPVLLENLPHVTPALIPYGDYVGHTEEITALIQTHKNQLRFGAWFLRDFDYEALWRKAHAEGISIFMTDHPLDLIALGL